MERDKLLSLLEAETTLAIDTETDGLNVRAAKITDIVFTGPSWSYCWSIREWNGSELVELVDSDTVKQILFKCLEKRLIMHNAAYDIPVIKNNYGIDLSDYLYCDTMLAAHTTDENKMSYGLKQLGVEVFGGDADEEKRELLEHLSSIGAGKDFYKADKAIRGKYAEQDGRLTYDLYIHYDKLLHEQGLADFFYRDEVMPLLREVTIPMEARGVMLDMARLTSLNQQIKLDIETIENNIHEAINPYLADFHRWYMEKEYPVKLSGEFLQTLAELMAPDSWPKTKSGNYSFSAVDVWKAKKNGTLPEQSEIESYIGVFTEAGKTEPLHRLSAELIERIRKRLHAKSGGARPFNLNSKDHLKRLFFGYGNTKSVLNEKPLNSTDKGSPQVDEEFLELMAKKYDWAAKLIIYNKLNKIQGTYYQRFLDEQEDGVFYPRFYQHRTVSGRYGSDFQQLPRPIESPQPDDLVAKYTNTIRELFISRDSSSFVDIDYESLEPHVFSHVSGDKGLQDIFNKGHDFYSTIAIGAENLTEYSADKSAENYMGKKNKTARQKAKAYALGIPYGLGDFKLHHDLGITQAEATTIIKNYFSAFPELKKWFDNTKILVCKQGFIKTEAGRIRHLPFIKESYEKYGECLFDSLELWKAYHESPATYQQMKFIARQCKNELNNARNVQIQSLGASIVNKASILIARELKKYENAEIVAQVHDQIVVECADEDIIVIGDMMQHIMTTCWPLSVKLKAPPSYGKNLGESKG